jgi:hypothetical protein
MYEKIALSAFVKHWKYGEQYCKISRSLQANMLSNTLSVNIFIS